MNDRELLAIMAAILAARSTPKSGWPIDDNRFIRECSVTS